VPELGVVGAVMRQWYVVHSQANAENRALTNLARQGYDTWLPLYRKTRRHARRIETVLRPLFPRYLFVRVDLQAEVWRPILSTMGVSDLVSGADGPLPVGDAVIDALKMQASEDGHFDLRPSAFKSGERVRIRVGPLADLEGIFQLESDAERVMVLLKLMGREVRVTVPSEDVESA
jgi:transcriptional antiterminator RfaH